MSEAKFVKLAHHVITVAVFVEPPDLDEDGDIVCQPEQVEAVKTAIETVVFECIGSDFKIEYLVPTKMVLRADELTIFLAKDGRTKLMVSGQIRPKMQFMERSRLQRIPWQSLVDEILLKVRSFYTLWAACGIWFKGEGGKEQTYFAVLEAADDDEDIDTFAETDV